MKLRVIAEPNLTLNKENKIVDFGETFDVDVERGIEILKTTYNGKVVAELVSEDENEELASLKDENKELKDKVAELEEQLLKLTENVNDDETKDKENANKNGKGKGDKNE